MRIKTRSQFSFLNMFTNVFGQALITILGFVTRTVFIYTLGRNYLGISSLFENVLQVLSITDLGLESAVVYSLYKPLQEKDDRLIASIMSLYKKAYRVIGSVILLAGVCLVPVIPYFTRTSTASVNMMVVYLLYLLQTASSYLLFSYRRTIYFADQRDYKASAISYIIRLVSVLAQIVWLLVMQEHAAGYYGYLIICVGMTIATNVTIGFKAGRDYPCICEKKSEKLPPQVLHIIKKNVVGTAFYKICGVITNSTDNLLISAMVNLDTVGMYSHYVLISGYVKLYLTKVFDAITASVGNLTVTASKEHSEFVFKCLCVANTWFYGFCGVALFSLINPFIGTVWLRNSDFVLPYTTVFLVFLNVIMEGIQHSITSYLSACGLYWKCKVRSVAAIVLNLVISIVLGKLIGLNGILLGTSMSYLVTMGWYDPWLLYREVFKKPVMGYFARYALRLALVIGVGLGLNELCCLLPETLAFFAVRVLIVLVVPNALFFLIYFRTKEFAYMKDALKRTVFHRLKRRR